MKVHIRHIQIIPMHIRWIIVLAWEMCMSVCVCVLRFDVPIEAEVLTPDVLFVRLRLS